MSFSFPNTNSTRLARRLAAGAAAVAIASLAIAPASAAGFLEALFGSRPAPYAAPAPTFRELTIPVQRHGALARKAPKKKKQKARAAPGKFLVVRPGAGQNGAAAGYFRPVVTARPPVLPGPLGPFLLDRTLYRGDIVVTTVGLRVFAGGRAARHAQASFLTLAHGKGYLGGRLSMLAAIERNNARGGPEISYRQYAATTAGAPGFAVLTPTSNHALLRLAARASGPAAREVTIVSR